MGNQPVGAYFSLPMVLAGALLLAVFAAGCDADSTQAPPPSDPHSADSTPTPPGGAPASQSGHATPAAVPVDPALAALPPVTWVELNRVPEIDGLTFAENVLDANQLLVIAVPLTDFPVVKEGDRTYHHAVFRDWSLAATQPVEGKANSPVLTTCLVAVSGTKGQLSVARERNFATGKTEIADASVMGDVSSFYLLFQVARGAQPRALQYQGKAVHRCADAAAPELINQLFLPVKPPGAWVHDVLDLGDHPRQVGDFGLLQKLDRKAELVYVDSQGQVSHQRPSEGKQYLECRFGPRTKPFDYRAADWHLSFADNTTFEPVGLSVNGGRGYHLNMTEAKGFVGQPELMPVLLFEVTPGSTPVRLQYLTQVVALPH